MRMLKFALCDFAGVGMGGVFLLVMYLKLTYINIPSVIEASLLVHHPQLKFSPGFLEPTELKSNFTEVFSNFTLQGKEYYIMRLCMCRCPLSAKRPCLRSALICEHV